LYFGDEISPESELASKALHGQNLCHPKYPELNSLVIEYMHSMTALAQILIKTIARSLHLPPNYFAKYTTNAFTPIRMFYYPKDDSGIHQDETERWGVGEHTDFGIITLLAQDDVGGLQVRCKVDNSWIEAPPIKDAFGVNIGNMLDIWTEGKYQATLHRVKNITSVNRLSIPYFFDPCFDALIEPPQNKPDSQLRPDFQSTSPWSKPFLFGSYIYNKVQRNFPELTRQANTHLL